MKHIIVSRDGGMNSGKAAHVRRNQWGRIIRPSAAMNSFKERREEGIYHPDYTWKQCCKAYRKKVRKMKIAKLSRKGSNKRVKRAR
jgi:sugar (pentulose or hexulose) kinase